MILKEFKINLTKIGNIILDKEPNLPLHCMLDVYRETGIYDYWKKYLEEHKLESADPKDYLFCSDKMLVDMREMIVKNWETFNIDIVGDNQVIWKPNDLHTRRKHGKKMHAKVRNSVNWDFLNYCPAVNNDVKYGVIAFIEPDSPNQDKVLDKAQKAVEAEEIKGE